MTYLKSKIKMLRSEYKGKDRKKIIKDAGKCSICSRVSGDEFLFGPTNYIKKRVRFKVKLDIHVIEGMPKEKVNIVLCDGCHLSYHLFNRLDENADFGNHRLSEKVYERCEECGELTCMCCKECGRAMKKCYCHKDSIPGPRPRTRAKKKPGEGPDEEMREGTVRVRR